MKTQKIASSQLRDARFDWTPFRDYSDRAYEQALADGNLEPLKSHNLQDTTQELDFLWQVIEQCFGCQPQGRALDVACGAGFVCAAMRERGLAPVGFDISQPAVTLAQKLWPDLEFFVGDGAQPRRYFSEPSFDLIHIREFHPFTRVSDLEYQLDIVAGYLELLRPGGFLVITHSRRGDCPHLGFAPVKRRFAPDGRNWAGPFFPSLYRRLALTPRCTWPQRLLWRAMRCWSRIVHRYPVEMVVLQKMD